MRYCNKCILPSTRPNLIIHEDGECNACRNFKNKPKINWKKREILFKKIINKAKKKSKFHDCLIPVSGGKDSTWQVVKCLDYGLTPLAVTWRTPGRTKLGQQNLDNLIRLGVDHIDYTIDPKIESRFALNAFKKFGTPGLPQHLATYQIPLKLALYYSIPLIIYGENSATEYGNTDGENLNFYLTENWINKYGVTHGTRASDWIDKTLTKKKMSSYFAPNLTELQKKKIKALYLGNFFKWDTENSYKIAKKNGFKKSSSGAKVGIYDYADIDCDLIAVHHFIKWYKFGFTRDFDNLSIEIRNKRIERKKAIKLIKKMDFNNARPFIRKWCKFTGISEKNFFEICEKFRNKKIWYKDKNTWKIKNFIIKDFNWK